MFGIGDAESNLIAFVQQTDNLRYMEYIGIPQGLKDLLILGMIKSTNATDTVFIIFNVGDGSWDETSNGLYRGSYFSGTGITQTDTDATEQAFGLMGTISLGTTANTTGFMTPFWMTVSGYNYEGGIGIPSIAFQSASTTLRAASGGHVGTSVARWKGLNRIDRIRFYDSSGGNITIGSYMSIYGMG